MGKKVSDGKTVNLTVPNGDATESYELYRINGINGICVTPVGASDTQRTVAFEVENNFIYEIHVPAGVNPAVGTDLYWSTPGSFQDGSQHLRTTPATQGDFPCFFVTKARQLDSGGVDYVIQGRLLNGPTGDSIGTS
jgi:hypothetical protein